MAASLKTLTVVTVGMERPAPEEARAREQADEFPRVTTFHTVLNSTLLDGRFMAESDGTVRGALYRRLPFTVAQVLETYRLRNRYDAVITWSEALGLLYGVLRKITGSTTPHVSLMYWMSKPKQVALLKRVHPQIDRIITWSSVQRDYAIRDCGVPPEKFVLVKHPVDQLFWRPRDVPTDMICSVGSENRDYRTLVKALEGLDIPCHIGAKNIRLVDDHRAVTIDAKEYLGELPPNITIGHKYYRDLRELYARSRIAVVPLMPSNTDNGISVILEAWAMGKAVICSRTEGQVDAIEHGKNALFVPQGDAQALREAILRLWNDPAEVARLGAAGRRHVEQYHTLDAFCANVRSVVEEVIEEKARVREPRATSRDGRVRTLTLLTSGLTRPHPAAEDQDLVPRSSLYERELNSDMAYENFLRSAPLLRRIVYTLIPLPMAQSLEAYFRRKEYDVIISWSDPHALAFGSILRFLRARVPNVAMMFWISKPKKAKILKRIHPSIDRIILWTSAHRDFAIRELGVPPSKIAFIRYYVDQRFWRPMPQPTDMICSAGVEMRDYPTLIDALRGLDIRCHIAAGIARGKLYSTVTAIGEQGPLPETITVSRLSPVELRALYARSRFVVIPLLESDSDNGLTVLLEAMAMGKAVICSRIKGQVDVIQEGVTGIFVPQGDPEALRAAILRLWNDPEEAERMGRAGRKFVEENTTWDSFVANVKAVVEEVHREHRHGR
jgi:glycosyltransferase involved in cell wall biosynthesis